MSNIIWPCEFNDNGICKISSKILGSDVKIPNNSCEKCTSLSAPRTLNNITVSLAISNANDYKKKKELLIKYKNELSIGMNTSILPVNLESPKLEPGPGTELHKLLDEKGYKITASCPCMQWIKLMNEKGPDWCIENINDIVISMRTEWKKRHPIVGLIFPNFLLEEQAANLVRQAVENFIHATDNT